ncbi:SLATT domain-containing protein [Actinomadura nitritigenes]|uniref:SLATT domain-containing protein n=1 Tax=Actinomadura nitritigenes TaxID=134602 RepID=UPI003D89D346
MSDAIKNIIAELDRLYDDASYSAQSYFEAAKSAALWGKTFILFPALVSSLSSFVIALGWSKSWGTLGAIAGAVAATAAFLGSDKKANSHLNSARNFTDIRHAARLEMSLAQGSTNVGQLEEKLRALRAEYSAVNSGIEPISNRFFRKAQKRIDGGVLSYEEASN